LKETRRQNDHQEEVNDNGKMSLAEGERCWRAPPESKAADGREKCDGRIESGGKKRRRGVDEGEEEKGQHPKKHAKGSKKKKRGDSVRHGKPPHSIGSSVVDLQKQNPQEREEGGGRH